jgi:hypothetical protein
MDRADVQSVCSYHRRRPWWRTGPILVLVALFLGGSQQATAQRIANQIAVFAALDKVTARISRLEIPLNETKSFGALRVTPRACNTRAPTEPPKTTTFVEIDEVMLNGKSRRIFTGWMFAESPGLNAVEHPVFDLWLTGCKEPKGSEPSVKSDGDKKSPSDTRPAPPRRRPPR